MDFSVPILLMVFNRPEPTSRVLARLEEVRPSRLFVAADGPRADKQGEREACARVRSLISSEISWPCDLRTLYRDSNLGCRQAVSQAISWFFDEVEEGIILEDDTLPEPSFFPYCRELLERYRHDERVGMISGDNFLGGARRAPYSYYFSHFTHIWGWATWRRAWRDYDVSMKLWPLVRDTGWLRDVLGTDEMVNCFSENFERVFRGELDTWDYQWAFACWIRSRLTLLPAVNLVSNIGFGSDATHTTSVGRLANLPTSPMPFPLSHPPFVIRDAASDRHAARMVFDIPGSGREHDERLLGVSNGPLKASEIVTRSLAEMQDGRVSVAKASLEELVFGESRERDLRYVYGLCCLKQGRVPEGLRAIEAELELHPDNEVAKEMLSLLNEQLKNR